MTELTKIHLKKKHEVPGPEHYDMRKNWVKKSPYDYEQNRGKQYRRDRITDVAELVKSVKKARSPAANHYKIKHTKRILGPANSKSAQLQSVANSQWYGKQTPGYHYKPNTVSNFRVKLTETCVETHKAELTSDADVPTDENRGWWPRTQSHQAGQRRWPRFLQGRPKVGRTPLLKLQIQKRREQELLCEVREV